METKGQFNFHKLNTKKMKKEKKKKKGEQKCFVDNQSKTF